MKPLIVLAIVLLCLSYGLRARNIILDWDAPNAQGITGYSVYRIYRSGNSVYCKRSIVRTAPTFADVVPDGKTYFYFVTVLYGNQESAPSNAIEVK